MNSRQRQERRHEIKVGLTIFIGLALLIFSILYIGQNRGVLSERYHLHCMMSRVNGLQPGAPVQLAGLRVGSVSKVDFSENLSDQKIRVLLEIDKDVQPRIRQNSEAHIGTLGLLGDKYIGITLGTLDQPMLREGDLLNSTDPIDVEELLGEGAKVFTELQRTSEHLTEISNKINTGTGTLGLLINDPRMYYDIDRILLLLENLSANLAEGDGAISQMLKDPELYNNLNTFLQTSISLVDSVKSGSGTLSRLIRDPQLIDQLLLSVESLQDVIKQIKTGEGTLGKTISDKALYEQVLTTISKIDSLILDVRRNPQRYLKVEIF